MQLARVIYKTPPRVGENAFEKLGRKFSEWWLAPVIYRELTRGGDDTPLRQWAANHLWLAQRTGGSPLHGVEVTSRIVFGKEAKSLTMAEQFVLASAVNKPIILLEGSDRLNAVRLDRWRYITEVRARRCAEELITDPDAQRKVVFELVNMAGGPPNPRIQPGLEAPLKTHAPKYAARARANPIIRANVLMPSARFGLREEMKQAFGYDWRSQVRGITTTLDVAENLAFNRQIKSDVAALGKRWGARLYPAFTFDDQLALTDPAKEMPQVIVVAADTRGRIVRYYENSQLAPYFGSIIARSAKTGRYVRALEPRQIASTGKMLAAISIANGGRDSIESLYLDTAAPARGLETCRRKGNLRRGRKAVVAFACSLNGPIERRAASFGQSRMKRLIDGFGFNMPPAPSEATATPPTTAAVRGLIAGSPRQVHQMAASILASLTGRGQRRIGPPTLVAKYDFTSAESREQFAKREQHTIVPNKLINRSSRALIRSLLQAPLCYTANGRNHGTLKGAKEWCAARRRGVRLHFGKTGTAVTSDPDATVDTWIAGGLQFTNGAAYSYVVVVGSGSAGRPFANKLHSSQLAVPLLRSLLQSLASHAAQNPVRLAQASGKPRSGSTTGTGRSSGAPKARRSTVEEIWRRLSLDGQ